MTSVYKLKKQSYSEVKHCVELYPDPIATEEHWCLRQYAVCSNIEEAEELVMKKTRKRPEFALWALQFDKLIEKDVRRFCFDAKYISKNTYFIGDPEVIRSNLTKTARDSGDYYKVFGG